VRRWLNQDGKRRGRCSPRESRWRRPRAKSGVVAAALTIMGTNGTGVPEGGALDTHGCRRVRVRGRNCGSDNRCPFSRCGGEDRERTRGAFRLGGLANGHAVQHVAQLRSWTRWPAPGAAEAEGVGRRSLPCRTGGRAAGQGGRVRTRGPLWAGCRGHRLELI
jgi:hypothetical protein